MTALNKALEWITKMAYLNLLWLGFSLLGFIVIGLFPATAATFTIVRKWLMGDTDIPLFKNFWQAYKQSLRHANILGYIVVAIYYILYLDFLFITLVDNENLLILTIPFLLILMIVSLTSLYIFPIYVHFDIRIKEVLKSSFFMMLLNPFQTISMALGSFALLFGLWHFQWFFPFFSMSVLAIILMMPSLKASKKVMEKQNRLKQESMIAEK